MAGHTIKGRVKSHALAIHVYGIHGVTALYDHKCYPGYKMEYSALDTRVVDVLN